MIKILLLFSVLLLLVSCGDKSLTLKRYHELYDEWFNLEQKGKEAANSFHPYLGLGLKWERGWTEVDRFCKVLKGSTEEF